MSNENNLKIPLPDDWHLHLRDGEALQVTVPHSASRCRRAIVMPNLKPPIRSVKEAADYKDRILSVPGVPHTFQPLMTLYLTDSTTAEEIARAAESDFVFAVKLYPAGATTNSDDGLTATRNAAAVFEAMEKYDLPLLIHAESTDPAVDVFDREAAFIESDLAWICESYPSLRMVFEHVSSAIGVEFVESQSHRMGATVTPHHLLLNRNDLLVGGLKPHHYCLPVVKTEADRRRLLSACLKNPNFFAGTDSAPHPRSRKESSSCAAGIYTAPFFPELYTMAFQNSFQESGNVQWESLQAFLVDFLCNRGPAFYRMPAGHTIDGKGLQIIQKEQLVPASYPFGQDELVPLYAGTSIPFTATVE